MQKTIKQFDVFELLKFLFMSDLYFAYVILLLCDINKTKTYSIANKNLRMKKSRLKQLLLSYRRLLQVLLLQREKIFPRNKTPI